MTILFLAAALGAQAATSAGGRKMDARPNPVLDASFECAAPAGWSVERRRDGVIMTGPAESGVPTRVIVRYVPAGSALYEGPEAYMARLTKPSSIPMKGWKDGPVEKVVVSGRRALRIVRDTSEFVPPESMSTKEVPVREEHLAVPAAKGFYLLIYSAPRAVDPASRPLFRKIVDSFKPKL